jgi:hypothetical protein
MGNKKSVYRLGIVVVLFLATLGAYAWSVTGTKLSSEAQRYERDRGCTARPLSAALRRAAADESTCRVERLVVDRRDVLPQAPGSDAAAPKSSGYIVTFASGPSRIRAALSAVPAEKLWASIEPGAALNVQFFDDKVSGFDLGGRFIATAGDPAVESSEHSVGVAFIPLAFLYLFGTIAYFAIGPPKRPEPKPRAKRGGSKPPARPGPKPAAKAAKR